MGSALAVHLSAQGREVLAVRTRREDVPRQSLQVTVQDLVQEETTASIYTVSLARLDNLRGILVVTAKAYANQAIAAKLPKAALASPIVLLVNGLDVEEPFLAAGASEVYRCVLFVTSQNLADRRFVFKSIAPSPIGLIKGSPEGLERVVRSLSTPAFPFIAEEAIRKRVWQKAIINSVFNSICPLLNVDNGVFDREEEARRLAREIVDECLEVTTRLGFSLDRRQILEQISTKSRNSTGQPISTLQDIRAGNPTEIDSLNLAIARIAAGLAPAAKVERARLLGELIRLKATLRIGKGR